MPQEQELDFAAPPRSPTLLDAVLQNLYDFGECKAPETHVESGSDLGGENWLFLQAEGSCRASTPLVGPTAFRQWAQHTLLL